MNEQVEEVVNHPLFIPVVVGVASFASGLGLGFFLGKRKYESFTGAEVHQISLVELEVETEVEKAVVTTQAPEPVVIDEEVAKEKGIIKVDSLADLSSVLPSEAEIVVTEDVPDPNKEMLVEVTVEEAEDGIAWDWEGELDARKDTAPYILHQEEFYKDELNFSQYSLTFYEMDGILADEDNVPVYNHSGVVGDLKFGHGSGQEDVVYVRNHERKAEYEITRIDDSFARAVHGLEIENNERIKDLKHGKVMKFRQD